MKRTIVNAVLAAAFISWAGVSPAEVKPQAKTKISKQLAQQDQAKPTPAPTGPLGFGALKVGLTRQAVEDLKEADGVYLAGPLEEAPAMPHQDPGVTRFNTKLITPLSSNPLTAQLSFKSGVVSGFSVTLDDSTFEQSKSQLISKYGAGVSTDDRKDEQCLYGNGANFKINWGSVSTRWVQHVSDTEQIRTSAVEFTIDMCPPSLRGPKMEPRTSRFIAFDDVIIDPTPKPNIF